MTDNLALWNSVADIDPAFTNPITGKDYQGTSPNPQYLIKLATEKLGPVGLGFGWRIIAEGFQPLFNQTLHWCRIEFWWRHSHSDGERFAFEEYGQTKAAYVTSKGRELVDEDAPKKSLTDAIVKALSHLGFAGNIFLGRWDDQKYVAALRDEFREEEKAAKLANTPPPPAEAIEQAITKMNDIWDLGELGAYWNGLAEYQPGMQSAPGVAEAKDSQKAAIEAKAKEQPSDSVDDDEVPF